MQRQGAAAIQVVSKNKEKGFWGQGLCLLAQGLWYNSLSLSSFMPLPLLALTLAITKVRPSCKPSLAPLRSLAR